MKRVFSLMLVLMLVLTMTACSGGQENTGGEEDGQNPVMNYVGEYVCGRAQILIGAAGTEDATVQVTWSSSAYEYSSWIIRGTFDSDTHTIKYEDGCRYDYVFEDENAEDPVETEVYTDGQGTITFTDGDPLTLVWQDDKEDIAKDMVFEYVDVLQE